MTAERSQHTPGQLWADEALFCQKHDDEPGYWFCRIFREPLVAGQIRTIFCEIERPTKEHAERDARLIAAAPELLDALKIAERSTAISLDYWQRTDQKRIEMRATVETLTAELVQIRAAIAKATGGAL